jgi:nitroreductase
MNMNEVIKNIHERRSVRVYQDKPIPKGTLDEIIKAGTMGPTGSNAQAWRFVVIQDKATRDKLAEMSVPLVDKWIEKYANEKFKALRKRLTSKGADATYYGAPVIIFVIGWGNSAAFDCSMACENMMLAARSMDIGSCWVHFGQLVVQEPEVKAMLELKDGESVFGPIIFGYPKGDFPQPQPKNDPVVKWI